MAQNTEGERKGQHRPWVAKLSKIQGKRVAVVGGGLAGTLATQALARAGCGVWLFNAPRATAATPAAAGLLNVLMGKRMRMVPDASRLVALAARALGQLACNETGLQPAPIFRPFLSQAEATQWPARLRQPQYARWVALQKPPLAGVHSPFGGVWVRGTGFVDVAAWVAHKQAMWAKGSAPTLVRPVDAAFDYSLLDPGTGTYAGDTFDAIIFAEGAEAASNPFWVGRGIVPLKGELLSLRLREPHSQTFAVSRGVYVLPFAPQQWVVGATHDRHFAHPGPTPEGRAQILEQLETLYPGLGYDVVGHRAGIRPTTPDHLPILGPHPAFPRIVFLNGLGTKGLLYGPWLAWQLAACLAGAAAWPETVAPLRKSLAVVG